MILCGSMLALSDVLLRSISFFRYLLFLMCNAAVKYSINCIFYINNEDSRISCLSRLCVCVYAIVSFDMKSFRGS